MIKVLGSLFVLTGGGLVWWFQAQERQQKRITLSDLMTALRKISEEIRIARTPLPLLLEKIAAECQLETAQLFQKMAETARRGENLENTWRAEVHKLSLGNRERDALLGLELSGDEEKICKAISLVIYQLAQIAEELERKRPEEEKRTTALCFSCAALLVILLI